MEFLGKDPIGTKFGIGDNTLELIKQFIYLRCVNTYKKDKKFQTQ